MILQSTIITSLVTLASLAPFVQSAYADDTNTHQITVVYTGHEKGQKMVDGKNVQDSTIPVGSISCGISGKPESYKKYDISSDTKMVVIPAKELQAGEGQYNLLDEAGHFIRDVAGKFKTESGPAIYCEYSIVGQGGYLGDFSAKKLKEIKIGETIKDNVFSYEAAEKKL
jgi:hypothetical protein